MPLVCSSWAQENQPLAASCWLLAAEALPLEPSSYLHKRLHF
jgi:hypothetical protein